MKEYSVHDNFFTSGAMFDAAVNPIVFEGEIPLFILI